MNGAREYAKMFTTGQYGKLYITSGSHARGYTFSIQILPENEIAIPNGNQNVCINKNAVEVYGVIGGNPGWTESYGWIHKGMWVSDFEKLVEEKEREIQLSDAKKQELKAKSIMDREKEISELLKSY